MAIFYDYENRTALDPYTGAGAPNAVGQVFAKTDTMFATPLTVTLMGSGLQVAEMTTDQFSQLPGFQVDGHLQVVFKSGDFTKVLNTTTPLVGPQGPAVAEAVDNGNNTVTFLLEDGTPAATVTLPQGPEGPYGGTEITDPQLTSLLTTPGTETNTALNATIAGEVESSADRGGVLRDKFAPKLIPGNDKVRSMVGAAAMVTPPTFSAGSTATLTRALGMYWTDLRWSGSPSYVGSGASSRYSLGPAKVDGTVGTSPTGQPVRIEFDHTGTAFEFRHYVTAGAAFTIWADEKPHSLTPQLFSGVAGAALNNNFWFKVDFGSRARRRIAIEVTDGGGARFSGFNVGVTDTVAAPSIPSPRVIWIGDSFAQGFSAAWKNRSYPTLTSRLLGWSDVWSQTAMASTGVVKGTELYGNYATRLVHDVVNQSPDVVVYQGSINDADQWPLRQGQVGPQLATDLAYLKESLPDALIVVTSPVWTGTAQATHIAVRDEMKPVVDAAGLPFLDLIVDSLTVAQGTKSYFTGTGDVEAPKGDGNADYYRPNYSDFHGTDAFHAELARILAAKIAPLVGQTL